MTNKTDAEISDDLLIKYEKELDLRYKFQNENEALKERVELLESYERLFKEGKINHHRNPHKKVVKIKGEILGAQSAYDHALMAGIGNMSVSTGLIIDLVDYAQQSDERIAELEKERDAYKNIIVTAREMFLDVDDMDVDSEEYAESLYDLFLLFCGGNDFNELLAIRDLEQQIAILEELQIRINSKKELGYKGSFTATNAIIDQYLSRIEKQLRKRTKGGNS